MVKKTTMSPFQLPDELATKLRDIVKSRGITLSSVYEQALTQWLDAGGVTTEATEKPEKAFCPAGMKLVSGFPAAPDLVDRLASFAPSMGGHDKMMNQMVKGWLNGRRLPGEQPKREPQKKLTPEEEREVELNSRRKIAAVRYSRGAPPLVGPSVFWHRKAHPAPWEIAGLDSPDWDHLKDEIKALCEKEYAEHVKAQEAEARARAAMEPKEPAKKYRVEIQGTRLVKIEIKPEPEDFA